MAEDDILKIGADLSAFKDAFDEANKVVDQSAGKWVKAIQSVNQAGEQVTLTRAISAHERLSVVLKTNAQGLSEVASATRTVSGAHAQQSSGISDLITKYNLYARAAQFATGIAKESLVQAVEFERQFVRIQQIHGGGQVSSGRIFDLAKQYNLEAPDVLGAYQKVLASGVGANGGADAILASASKLAQVVGTDAVNAAQDLTAAMAAYGQTAAQASRTTDLFVDAWKHGIPITGDFANAFGRMALIAKPLGVTMEDLIGTMEVFRQSGVAGAQAASLLSNFLTRATVPTEGLREKFRALGAETANELIVMRGYSTFLKTIFDDTKDASEVTELFKNSIGGSNRSALALSGVIEKLTTNIERLGSATGQADKALVNINENIGERTYSYWNKLSQMIKQVGVDLLETSDHYIKVQEDIDRHYKSGYTPKEERDLFAQVWSKEQLADYDAAVAKKNQPQEDARLLAELSKQINADRVQDAIEHFGKIRAAYLEHSKEAERIEKLTTENIKNELSVRFKSWEDSVRKQREVATRAEGLGRQSKEKVEQLRQQYGEGKFGRQETLFSTDLQQQGLRSVTDYRINPDFGENFGGTNPYRDRYASLIAERNKYFSSAASKTGQDFLDSKDPDRAREAAQKAGDLLERSAQAVNKAYMEGRATQWDVVDAENKIRENMEAQVSLEKQLQQAMEAKATASKKSADDEEIRIRKVKAAVDDALKISIYDAKGAKVKSPEEASKEIEQYAKIAEANTKGVAEFAQVRSLFEQQKQSVLRTGARIDEDKGQVQAAEQLKFLGDHMSVLNQPIELTVSIIEGMFNKLAEKVKEAASKQFSEPGPKISDTVSQPAAAQKAITEGYGPGSKKAGEVAFDHEHYKVTNVVINAGPDGKPQVSVQAIVRALQKEQRKGTIKIVDSADPSYSGPAWDK